MRHAIEEAEPVLCGEHPADSLVDGVLSDEARSDLVGKCGEAAWLGYLAVDAGAERHPRCVFSVGGNTVLIDQLRDEIEWYAGQFPPPQKVFLADGDAHMAKASFLGELLDAINSTWPDLNSLVS